MRRLFVQLLIFVMLFLTLYSSNIFAALYQWKDENGNLHFSDTPPPDDTAKDSLTVTNDTQGLYHPDNYPDWRTLRHYLRSENFTSLKSYINNKQSAFQEDKLREEGIVRTMNYFRELTQDDVSLLKKWQKEDPKSYIPDLALGLVYVEMGIRVRGVRTMHRTPPRRIENMHKAFNKALSYFQQALNKKHNLVVAYIGMIQIYHYTGDRQKAKAALNNALSINPLSLYTRVYYMASLQPRWGGSFAEMEGFAHSAQRYASRNPHLKWLKGSVPYHKYFRCTYSGSGRNCSNKFSFLEQALEYGDNPVVIYARAKEHFSNDNYDKALKDLNWLIVKYPLFSDALAIRAKIYAKKGNHTQSNKDIDLALDVDPMNELVERYFGRKRLYRQNSVD